MIATIIESISKWAMTLIGSMGYLGVFILMSLESACIPIPSEVIMPFAGAIVTAPLLAKHTMSLPLVTLSGTLGCLFGSIIAYWIGRQGGRPLLLRYGKYILITEKKLDYVDAFFDKHGEKAIFWSRVLPIVRTFISLPAGICEMSFTKFVLYSTLGSLPWCLFLAYIGYYLGDKWTMIKPYFHKLDAVMAVVIVATVIYIVYRWKKKRSK